MDRKLIEYLPLYVRDYKEIQEIMKTDELEISEMWKCLEGLLNDQFVQVSTDAGLARWETILGIIPKNTDTFDERRFRILARLNEQLPYTVPTINEQLSSLCGKDGYLFLLDNDNYSITVKLALSNKNNFEDVMDYLRRVVPANMEIIISLLYNTYNILSQFTHSQLSRYTYAQLREHVLEKG